MMAYVKMAHTTKIENNITTSAEKEIYVTNKWDTIFYRNKQGNLHWVQTPNIKLYFIDRITISSVFHSHTFAVRQTAYQSELDVASLHNTGLVHFQNVPNGRFNILTACCIAANRHLE